MSYVSFDFLSAAIGSSSSVARQQVRESPKGWYSLRGCLKKIDKIAFYIVLGVVSLSGSGE